MMDLQQACEIALLRRPMLGRGPVGRISSGLGQRLTTNVPNQPLQFHMPRLLGGPPYHRMIVQAMERLDPAQLIRRNRKWFEAELIDGAQDMRLQPCEDHIADEGLYSVGCFGYLMGWVMHQQCRRMSPKRLSNPPAMLELQPMVKEPDGGLEIQRAKAEFGFDHAEGHGRSPDEEQVGERLTPIHHRLDQ